MTSKIKVDNIENQCGGAVVTKCGGTTTISGSVVKANNIQASDGGNIASQSGTTITLGASGDTVTLASGASHTGFGRTGTVDWQTGSIKTSTFTAANGEGYFCNTSGGAFTVNLPAGVAGAIVSVADYSGTFQTNNLTIVPNGTDKIGSENENAVLSTEGQSVTLVFVDSTQGWINTMDSTSNVRATPPYIVATGGTPSQSGDYEIRTFTGPGTFAISSVSSCAARNKIDWLVIGGGGSGGDGGTGEAGGGGGAGGYRESPGTSTGSYTVSPLAGGCAVTATVTSYPITVGAGGTPGLGGGNPAPAPVTAPGSSSTGVGITSAGGGGGSGGGSSAPFAGSGGSGGGGNGRCGPGTPGNSAGQPGNNPPVSPPQGNTGGNGQPSPGNRAGGGGGATAVGGNASSVPTTGGTGGAGATSSINGTPTGRAGGGGGGNQSGPSPAGGSSSDGGGQGGKNGPGPARAGAANTGGGGGGNSCGQNMPGTGRGGNAGSGVVILRYKYQN